MQMELTGELDALRLKMAQRIDSRAGNKAVRKNLAAVLALLTAAADRAEEAGL